MKIQKKRIVGTLHFIVTMGGLKYSNWGYCKNRHLKIITLFYDPKGTQNQW